MADEQKPQGIGPVFRAQEEAAEKQARLAATTPEQAWLGEWLKSIDNNLRGIKNILTFFLVLAILGALAQACTALGLIR